MSKKILLCLPLIVWLTLSIIEVYKVLIIKERPMIWRAWEVASNYNNKDSGDAPFKPLFRYDGTMYGDLLNAVYFKPKKEEARKQIFQVDEYGYRNELGLLKKQIVAVIPGSSFIGGAQETQEDLISELLTKKYNIPTYNLATFHLQAFWEDGRFLENKPKYALIVGNEGEIISSRWRYELVKTTNITHPKSWSSFEEWEKANDLSFSTFKRATEYLKNFSVFRYISNELYLDYRNFNKTRAEVVSSNNHSFTTYEPETGMLFYQLDYDNPKLGSEGKTEKDIQLAINSFKNTVDLLKTRNIQLIVVAVPSKAHLYAKKYADLKDEERAILFMEEELRKNNINYIHMFRKVHDLSKDRSRLMYYPDDSHWTSEVNRIIAEEIATKIKELENSETNIYGL